MFGGCEVLGGCTSGVATKPAIVAMVTTIIPVLETAPLVDLGRDICCPQVVLGEQLRARWQDASWHRTLASTVLQLCVQLGHELEELLQQHLVPFCARASVFWVFLFLLRERHTWGDTVGCGQKSETMQCTLLPRTNLLVSLRSCIRTVVVVRCCLW